MAETEHRPTNFIRQIIDKDLANGVHTSIKTRFPPEPNGFLHIGHAKSICLNFGIARDYQGSCNLRFDDTNPAKEDIEYVNSIQQDVKWLGFEWDGEARYSSDYFDQLHGFAVELIEKGLAYVDFSTQEAMREMRGTLTEPGKNSPYRDTSIETNLQEFAKMTAGEYPEGHCSLRAKIDMTSPFMCMRDPVIYRIKFAHHHQTGEKWCVYPMYDFTHCISDAIEGITHSLCTLEFQDNRRLYDWVIENITIDCTPHQYEFSRLNLEYTVLSKRRLIQLVEEKHVAGWDDPRMPTIAGLRRRGYTPGSVREFCLRIGVTKMDNMVEMSMLEACIRDDLNVNAPRAMAVLEPIKLVIENFPEGESETLTAPNHPNDESMGTRNLKFGREVWIEAEDFRESANKKFKRLVLDKEVRLRNAYVVKANRVEKDAEGNVTTVYCTYDPDTLGKDPADGRKVKGVIHWVDVASGEAAQFRLYDRLFNVPNPAAEENFVDAINPDSLIVKSGWVEPGLPGRVPEVGSWQFERTGYFCLDKDSTSEQLVFNQTVGLRDTWAKIGD
ncbi:MAG: glutamine--tRNA ligase [Pseudomonadota bacterium]|uniref:Glutamine--tRNA ligase n=1 Tax=Alteromonas alba TaxID=2079529 RepID=A0A2S9VCC1_9ALTE|nr:glutamine--tRNA ligase [Alteromonas alba]MCP4863746.1 glutamine--tRNA ligase [Alteromonas sp.]MDY6927621.1 glutamine--tRNA ligase [Pseudomonadota bacterium]PRO74107.1 glutamine--tRNA ligase [Alteromonas alba]|tara:strand:- start:4459 stop:6126 length:1668 start_codon:yes stop_codon:yes gene_type:complete